MNRTTESNQLSGYEQKSISGFLLNKLAKSQINFVTDQNNYLPPV